MTTIGNLPEVVSQEEWLAARKQLLRKEKELTRAHSAGRRPAAVADGSHGMSEKRSVMTQHNQTLATTFEEVSGRLLTVAEGLSDAAWDVIPPGEARTAGQIAYHMAEIYDNFSGLIQLAVGGQPLPALTMEIVHGINAEQAARYASRGRAGALELLRQNSATTVALLHTLSDAQLDTSTEFFGHSMTVADLAQNGLVKHTEEHLASIQGGAAAT